MKTPEILKNSPRSPQGPWSVLEARLGGDFLDSCFTPCKILAALLEAVSERLEVRLQADNVCLHVPQSSWRNFRLRKLVQSKAL
jgi:hypothetical protein